MPAGSPAGDEGDADAAAVKDLTDWLSREIQKSGDRTAAEKRHHNDAFHDAVEKIYGKSFRKVMKEMLAPDERFAKFMDASGGDLEGLLENADKFGRAMSPAYRDARKIPCFCKLSHVNFCKSLI